MTCIDSDTNKVVELKTWLVDPFSMHQCLLFVSGSLEPLERGLQTTSYNHCAGEGTHTTISGWGLMAIISFVYFDFFLFCFLISQGNPFSPCINRDFKNLHLIHRILENTRTGFLFTQSVKKSFDFVDKLQLKQITTKNNKNTEKLRIYRRC